MYIAIIITSLLFTVLFSSGVSSQSCSTVGRHPVAGSNCKKYIHCTAVGTTLHQTNFTCPGMSVFNSKIQQCVTNTSYTCNENICEQRGPQQPDFEVLYGDSNDSTNKSYFRCVWRNGAWTTEYGICDVHQCFVYDAAVNYREGCCITNPTVSECGPSNEFTCGF